MLYSAIMADFKESKYYGIHACAMLAEKRPEEIVRLYIEEENVRTFSALLKWCAKTRKAYHILPSCELDKVSDSVHHEGICIVAKSLPVLLENEFLSSLKKDLEKVCLLYLDGVENPHNLGSILRTAAHFGVPYILGHNLPSLSPSACRIAKGGAEIVRMVAVRRPADLLAKLRTQGFSVIATSSHAKKSLYQLVFPCRTILAIGSESMGLSRFLMKQVADSVRVPGTGLMESLNVAVAAGLCMGEYGRQHTENIRCI